MRRQKLLLLALIGAIAAGAALAAAAQQPSTFRTGVEVVSLTVTVTDQANQRFITDLERDDFQVFEDGVKQELTFFTRTQTPIALTLLLDTSASMDDKLAVAQEAATGFARRLRPEDLAAVIDFDSRVQVLQPFTNDAAALEAAIRKTTADGSTAMYNAIYIALSELRRVRAKSPDEVRRQAVVLLSDGEDTSSLLPYEEVLERAKRSETAIYAIGIRGKEAAGARGFREAEFVLRQLSQETGGRVFFPSTAAELPAIYTQISDELASQYTLGYTSKNARRDGSWRRVVVRLNRSNATARTKQGYYAPTPN
jgi:Ca-activated chloride channel homolog